MKEKTKFFFVVCHLCHPHTKYHWKIGVCLLTEGFFLGGGTPSPVTGPVPGPPYQWRIQDFPEGGAPTAKVGAPTYYFR